jgi:hypothetical protein
LPRRDARRNLATPDETRAVGVGFLLRRLTLAARGLPGMKDKDVHMQEVLFEMRRVGNSVRVSAIDPITNIEVTIIGDPRFGEEALKRTAMRKLKYVIAKRREQE